ncbi:hypothetical protein [Natrialbaceae archaeon AArc-T1-2]|uniref:hypothetical protein n=1 Tax=Natrialbaceae archaeon AArc-T1-2 TaxID=3053904 RepID=UPI00255B3588|nr:hypothetical protein [Natrialbaceae archaeon AArc-T1-2]WIV67407.1 hypothetical protein QQ977_01370 [Natrialbaceae archaeon AArc-T1-2]
MIGSRALTAVVGLVVGLAVSVAVWLYFETLLLFLFVPFVPFLFASRRRDRRPTRHCPRCGFQTTDPEHEYCPRDGTRLRDRDHE